MKLVVVAAVLVECTSAGERSSSHWRTVSAANPSDANAFACVALAVLAEGDLQAAMPLLHAAVKRTPSDYVATESLAGAYGMYARKLASVASGGEQVAQQESRALELSARYFAQAAKARPPPPAAPASGAARHSRSELRESPQLAFDRPWTTALRGWGDALAWLGRSQESEAVFQRGVEAGGQGR